MGGEFCASFRCASDVRLERAYTTPRDTHLLPLPFCSLLRGVCNIIAQDTDWREDEFIQARLVSRLAL